MDATRVPLGMSCGPKKFLGGKREFVCLKQSDTWVKLKERAWKPLLQQWLEEEEVAGGCGGSCSEEEVSYSEDRGPEAKAG